MDMHQAIESVLDTAIDHEMLEVIVRLDDDDVESIQAIKPIDRVTWIVGDREDGYASMARFWNEMARLACGAWLLPFNDDARMLKEGWDLALDQFDFTKPCRVAPIDNTRSRDLWIAFPILPRAIYHKWGYITQYCGIDTWNHHALKDFPVYKCNEIEIQHRRPDLAGWEGQHVEPERTREIEKACAQWDHNFDYWREQAEVAGRLLQ